MWCSVFWGLSLGCSLQLASRADLASSPEADPLAHSAHPAFWCSEKLPSDWGPQKLPRTIPRPEAGHLVVSRPPGEECGGIWIRVCHHRVVSRWVQSRKAEMETGPEGAL